MTAAAPLQARRPPQVLLAHHLRQLKLPVRGSRIRPLGRALRRSGFRSLKRPGADRVAGRPHDGDLVSFLVQ
jgi:hypothetical protein